LQPSPPSIQLLPTGKIARQSRHHGLRVRTFPVPQGGLERLLEAQLVAPNLATHRPQRDRMAANADQRPDRFSLNDMHQVITGQ